MAPSNSRWRIPFAKPRDRQAFEAMMPTPAPSTEIAGAGPRINNAAPAVAPSPSVEPPQVSAYKFNASPSPAYVHFGVSSYTPTDESSFPPQKPPGTEYFRLDQISETGEYSPAKPSSETGENGVFQEEAQSSKIEALPHIAVSPFELGSFESSASTPSGEVVGPPRIIPRQPRMHPAAFAITPGSGPRPPDEIVLHNEVTRHGGMYEPNEVEPTTEAEYQVAIAPPVTPRPPPPSILIEPAALDSGSLNVRPKSPLNSVGLNTTTWVAGSEAISSLAPPVLNDPMSSPNPDVAELDGTDSRLVEGKTAVGGIGSTAPVAAVPAYYDVSKPTCSINLVCYRSGAKGCDLQQIQCILRSKFINKETFESTLERNPHLIHSDERFFCEMRRLFQNEMSGYLRRYFSLKSLRAFRVLVYTPTKRPTVVPFDDFVLQEMMYAFQHPERLTSEDDWVQWVFRLRRKDRRHAIEFVEGWNTTRIAIAGTIPWLSSCIVGIAWTAAGGDVQSAFTVASFILTSSSGSSLRYLGKMENAEEARVLTGCVLSDTGLISYHKWHRVIRSTTRRARSIRPFDEKAKHHPLEASVKP